MSRSADNGVLVVLQPSYLPWIGTFDLMWQSSIWVWYDDVQFTKRDWRNRGRVAGSGEPTWITVPVHSKGRYHQQIRQVEVDNARPWARKHLETIRHCYASSPFFDDVIAVVRPRLEAGFTRLADLTIDFCQALAAYLGIAPRFVRSSSLCDLRGTKQTRLLDVCSRFEAGVYLSGPAARSYIEPGGFRRAGLELRFISYDYPTYERGGRPFIPGLSILDPLCWLGPEATLAYIRENSRWQPG